jgi:hypothetical protein
MVQTLTVWSNGTAEINTGTNFLPCDGVPFTDALQDKLDAIESAISSAGISQLHVEKDTFREFEHAVSAGVVSVAEFGSTVSSVDFDWIMQHVDAEIAAQTAGVADAEGATA